ncbi:TetR/AcrR family transcriptional regulator [Aquisalimonas asiatica]|nr:TetR/AcrR family transcriptional regulator [Aquisalimonas asiatica]
MPPSTPLVFKDIGVEPSPAEGGRAKASARDRLLRAAGELFYEHGIGAIGVDAIVERAGVAKMTLYRNFRSKSELVCAWLERRDQGWQALFERTVLASDREPGDKILAIFDVLEEWFNSDDFQGCAYINADAERVDADAHTVILRHKQSMHDIFRTLAKEAGLDAPESVSEQLFLLMEGSMVTARVQRSSWPAAAARAAAARIIGQ